MKILIASPSYDGSVRVEYMMSILALSDHFRRKNIEHDVLVRSSTLLHVLRSVMASKALLEDGYTHLLFVDTDMGFTVSAVERMLRAEKPVIGCAYPYRTIPLHEDPPEGIKPLRRAISSMVPYAVTFDSGAGNVQVVNGICEVASVGTGLMLISREALQTMRERAAVESYAVGFPYNQWFKGPQYVGFFEHIKLNGAYVGEDYSFCHRWRHECKEPLYALVDEEVQHVGPLPVLGRYTDKLKIGKF